MFTKNKNKKAPLPGGTILLNKLFEMKLPPDWTDQSIYRFEGPEEDGIRHNIYLNIEHNVESGDIIEYAQKNMNAVAQELQGYEELKQGQVTLTNGIPAFEVVYKWCPVEDREVYQRVVYVLIRHTGYILTASFSKKSWKMFGPVVDEILMSFAVTSGESVA